MQGYAGENPTAVRLASAGQRGHGNLTQNNMPDCPGGGARVPEHLAAVRQRPACCVNCSSALNSSEHAQQFQCRHLGNGATAYPREDVALEAAEDSVAMNARPERGVWVNAGR